MTKIKIFQQSMLILGAVIMLILAVAVTTNARGIIDDSSMSDVTEAVVSNNDAENADKATQYSSHVHGSIWYNPCIPTPETMCTQVAKGAAHAEVLVYNENGLAAKTTADSNGRYDLFLSPDTYKIKAIAKEAHVQCPITGVKATEPEVRQDINCATLGSDSMPDLSCVLSWPPRCSLDLLSRLSPDSLFII